MLNLGANSLGRAGGPVGPGEKARRLVEGNGHRGRPSAAKPARLHDKQSEPDNRDLPIDKVGVRGLRFPIQVRDKARAVQNTVATIGMFVDLPKEFKGTHMSRFLEVLNAHGNIVHVENLTDILLALQAKFHAGVSHLEIEFPYFMVKRAPVSRRHADRLIPGRNQRAPRLRRGPELEGHL